MSEADRYPWILRKPARERHLPPAKPSGLPMLVCGRCGWESRGRRKKCPACFARFETRDRTVQHTHNDEAGHLGGSLEQILILIVLVLFILILLRVVGVQV